MDISESRYHLLCKRKPCRDKNYTIELYDATLRYTKIYEGDILDCWDVAVQKSIFIECNCYLNNIPIHKYEGEFPELCYNYTQFSESEIATNKICDYNLTGSSTILQKHIKKCKQYGIKKCDMMRYNTNVQKTNFIDKSRKMNKDGLESLKLFYSKLYPEDPENIDYMNTISNNIIPLVLT